MTNLDSVNFKEIIHSTLQEFFNQNSLPVSPGQDSILLWTNPNPKYPNSFILKWNNQKLIGLTRTDKKGETYWKFKIRPEKETENSAEFTQQEKPDNLATTSNSSETPPSTSSISPNSSAPNQSESDAIAKYQQRMAKTQALNNHDQSKNNEPSANSQSS